MNLNDGENSTIVCPKYGNYYTVIEIRSVFYGNGSCPSNNGSKIDVMKRCQGRNKCYLEASTKIFNYSCPGVRKFLTVTYRCQSGECKNVKYKENGALTFMVTRGRCKSVILDHRNSSKLLRVIVFIWAA